MPEDLLKPTRSSDISVTLLDSLTILLNTMIPETLADDGVIFEGRTDSPDISSSQKGRGLVAVAVEPVARNQSRHARVWFLDMTDLPDASELGSALEQKILQWKEKIEALSSASVLGVGVAAVGDCARGSCRCCCKDRPMLGQDWQLLDGATRSHAGPHIKIKSTCKCAKPSREGGALQEEEAVEGGDGEGTVRGDSASEERGNLASLTSAHAITAARAQLCKRRTCLNGGQWVPAGSGKARCICPGNPFGPRCKILARHFETLHLRDSPLNSQHQEPSYLWLPSLPTCSHLHISLHLLTSTREGTIFSVESSHGSDRKGFAVLQLVEGRLQLLLKTTWTLHTMSFKTTETDNTWHRIDIIWVNETITMSLDHCLDVALDPLSSSSQKVASLPLPAEACRTTLTLPAFEGPLGWGGPLLLGGAASTLMGGDHSLPPFLGCLSHFKVNKKLHDLGRAVTGANSSPGCPSIRCLGPNNFCHNNARCSGSPGAERCECKPGYSGASCDLESSSVTFHVNSFVNVALSFTPPEDWLEVEFRVRTRASSGLLVMLRSRHNHDWLSVELLNGSVCLVVGLRGRRHFSLCAQNRVDDGDWHHVLANRHGGLLLVSCNHGEDALYASSLLPELQELPFSVSRQRGVFLGGEPIPPPEQRGENGLELQENGTVERDFNDGCMSSVRICGQWLPLPPTASSATGVVTAESHITAGCSSASCTNVTCPAPLTCGHTWSTPACGCAGGEQQSRDTGLCHDIDECLRSPCLYGGTCVNTHPGYHCFCRSGYQGEHCEWGAKPLSTTLSSDITITALAAAASAFIIFVIVAVFLWLGSKRKRTKQRKSSTDTGSQSECGYLERSKSGCPQTNHGLTSFSDLALARVSPTLTNEERSSSSKIAAPQQPNGSSAPAAAGVACSLHSRGDLLYCDVASSEQMPLALRSESVKNLIKQRRSTAAETSIICNKLNQLSILGLDLVNLPPPDFDGVAGESPPPPLPPPPEHIDTDNTSFVFDGGGGSEAELGL